MSANREQQRQALQAIADRNGGKLQPRQVVEAAQDPESPLHTAFTWNDEAAAAAYRLEQARQLIRSIRIDISTETRTVSTVAYVRDPDCAEDEQGYVSVARVRSDTDRKRDVLVAEFRRAGAALRRARALADLFDLADEVDVITAEVAGLERYVIGAQGVS